MTRRNLLMEESLPASASPSPSLSSSSPPHKGDDLLKTVGKGSDSDSGGRTWSPHAVATVATYKADILFHVTSFTRWFLDVLDATLQKLKKSSAFGFIENTSQSVRILSVVLVAMLSAVLLPLESKQNNLFASRFTYLTYFTAFSLHVGSQFWMTFVSGLSLYFNLTRHAFGDVQKILFPRYFTLNCTLSAVTVVQFARLYAVTRHNDFHTFLQLISLTLCFAVEFYVRLFLVPTVLELISSKTTIEKAAGIGQEVGHYELGPLLQCPHYMSIHRSFRRMHTYTAIGNIVAIACSAFHLYFLAYKYTDTLMI